jgi:hypothetical protein
VLFLLSSENILAHRCLHMTNTVIIIIFLQIFEMTVLHMYCNAHITVYTFIYHMYARVTNHIYIKIRILNSYLYSSFPSSTLLFNFFSVNAPNFFTNSTLHLIHRQLILLFLGALVPPNRSLSKLTIYIVLSIIKLDTKIY